MLVGLVIASVIAYYLYRELYGKRKNLPPGPTPWPVAGNLLQLDNVHPEKTLFDWGKKYGPVFTVWLPLPMVVVNDYDLMKETFLKQGDTFADRPDLFLFKALVKGNYGLFFTNGKMWRENRRFSLHALRDFGVGRNTLQPQIMDQALQLVDLLHNSAGEPITLLEPFTFGVANVINVLAFGYAWKSGDPVMLKFMDLFDEFSVLFQRPSILLLESYPWLRHFEPPLPIGFKRLNEVNDAIFKFILEEIEKHKKTLNEDEPPRDYTDAYLIEMRKRQKEGEGEMFTEWQMAVAIGDLWTAGFATTVATLRFAIIYLLNNPLVQQKLQEEMDRVIGNENELTMDDQKRLPYLCATIQEVLRAGNIVPINVQHAVTEDVVVGGFLIPKNTQVIAQTPSLHLDEKLFDEPEKFMPERFIDADGHFVKNDHVLPFSLGKRACMGESLVRMELFLFLGTLIQRCDFRPVDGVTPPPIVIQPGFLHSPVPYKCIVVPRK
uniref:Cytochrome P450 n=1 Tax=Plectus sambesii TaxID=2011161 RepID=A0A914W9B2_9BILA